MKMKNFYSNKRIFVAGHRGLVGSAIIRKLHSIDALDAIIITRTSQELDLRAQHQVDEFFSEEKIDVVILAAAKVGGIHANNTYPAEFIYQNLAIETNVIHAAWKHRVSRLLFLGSSCIYPKFADQPMKEDALMTGVLEPTNEPYAVAKIAGIKMCESYNRQYGTDFRSVMPTNLYGPGDNFDLNNSHVVPALIRKFHAAKRSRQSSVEVWGSGNPKREFLYVDDMAEASLHVLAVEGEQYRANTSEMCSHVNVGTGRDLLISELAEMIRDVVGYDGAIVFNPDMPDGAPRKLLDVSRLDAMGWHARTSLRDGLRETYRWFLSREGDEDRDT